MNRIWDFGLFGNKEAMIDDTGVSVSYHELEALMEQLSGMIEPGELTMMLGENSIGALSGYAALLNGAHPVLMVSAGLDEEMRRQIMNTYRPGYVFAPQSLNDDFGRMTRIHEIDDYMLFRTNYISRYPLNPSLGQLITTSGSTGSVKFVRQSFDNIRCNGRLIKDALKMTDSERTITALPMNYTYGLSVLCANLMAGGTMIVTKRGVLDEEFWELFINEHVTAFHGVPGTYEIVDRLKIFSEDFPDLRIMTQAGGKLRADLHRIFAGYARDYGKSFVIMYGQSEATAAISYLKAEKAAEKVGSVGYVFPGGTIELLDQAGKPVKEADTPGELVYRGENVTLGYASHGEDLSRGDDRHGELHTGDIACMDSDGYLYISGRLNRYIKVAGYRISLDEIDSMIMNDLHIQSVSSGEDDDLVIFVLGDEQIEPVRDYVIQKFKAIRSRFRIERIEAFPVNDGGKILYGELLGMAKKLSSV